MSELWWRRTTFFSVAQNITSASADSGKRKTVVLFLRTSFFCAATVPHSLGQKTTTKTSPCLLFSDSCWERSWRHATTRLSVTGLLHSQFCHARALPPSFLIHISVSGKGKEISETTNVYTLAQQGRDDQIRITCLKMLTWKARIQSMLFKERNEWITKSPTCKTTGFMEQFIDLFTCFIN